MSIEIMSLVFKAEMTDLPYKKDGKPRNAKASTVKLLLLAYADHANDEGEGAYPGYDKLETKTALSRQGIADTLEAVKQNGFMVLEGLSKWNTNSYRIIKDKLKGLVKPLDSDESSHLTSASQATRLKPSLNHPVKPSLKEGASAAPKPPKANDFPSNILYREVTEKYPAKSNWFTVLNFIHGVSVRLGRQPTKDDLFPFYEAWTGNGWNQYSVNWLEYAVKGELPKMNGAKHANTTNRQSNAGTRNAAQNEIDPEQLERDRALGERIKARRAAQQASV